VSARRALLAGAAVLALGAAAGCSVDNRTLMTGPGPNAISTGAILIGTFENGVARPEDPRFATYQYYAYNPDTNLPPGAYVRSPIVAPGYNSNYALGLDWEVIDPLDGVNNYPGVGVRTLAAQGFVDLTGYDRLVFAQRYQHSGDCNILHNITILIFCDELNTSFTVNVPTSPTWTTSSVPFSSFAEPAYQTPSGYGINDCLAVMSSLDFTAQAVLNDGECGSGNLTFDNIEIRPAPAAPDAGTTADADAGTDGP
jgi:hypothetical protein